jgi:hypothetical protein
MKFKFSELASQLTVIVIARNLSSLFYPFVESFWSAIPLGCRFLVGNFSSTDNTAEYFVELSRYAPVDVVNLTWHDTYGLTAIGVATQDLLNLAPTPFVYNLQACEVLCPDAVESIFSLYHGDVNSPANTLCQAVMRFRHFFGSTRFEGTINGHAYGASDRLLPRNCDMTKFDGSYSTTPGGPLLGMVHRYSYSFRNQILAKTKNHEALFGHEAAAQQRNLAWCRANPNYDGYHPPVAQHLLGLEDYDPAASLALFKQSVEPF